MASGPHIWHEGANSSAHLRNDIEIYDKVTR